MKGTVFLYDFLAFIALCQQFILPGYYYTTASLQCVTAFKTWRDIILLLFSGYVRHRTLS